MASTISSSLPDQLQNSFRQLTRRIALLTIFRGIGKLLLLVAVLLGAALLSDFLFDWGTTGRTIWQSALGLGALGGVWFFILNPLRKSRTPAELATLIDLHHPELRERLSATVEFSDPTIPEAHKGSALMREYVREETLQSLPRVDVARSLPTDRMKRALLTGLAAVGILLLPFVLSPQNYALLWSRLIQPNGNFANASNLYFEIANADRIVARGSNVEIAATPMWRYARTDLPETIWLNRVDDAGNTDRRRLERDDQTEQFVVLLPHVNQDFEYFLTADSSRSEAHQIEVKDAPEVFSLEVLYEPPAYTGLPAQTFSTATGRIEAFERSKVVLKPTFNKPAKSIDFAWEESAASIDDEFRADGTRLHRELALPQVELAADRLSAEIAFQTDIEGPYTLTLTDEHGLHNLQDPPRSLQILRDQPPTLALEAGELDRLEAKASDTLQVPVIVSDDIGVGELELHLTLPDESVEVVSAENEVLGVQEMSYRFRVDLSLFGLKEGDVLNWRV